MAAVLICLSSFNLRAQTNGTASARHSSKRFLFIVETSRAMRPRAGGVFDAMKRALDSSLNGEIHQGDLVGIWTFNENVDQGLFPSQEWSQPTQLAFAVRLQTLADPDTYLKRARLEKVIPEMLKVISENEYVTMILVSCGEGSMQGAPFSAQINTGWKEWHDEQEGVHMPLLTVLRTRNGRAMDWLLTPAPRPIELPAFAVDSQSADDKETNPAGVILESGVVSKKATPATMAPEQQVAFSVWALGKTTLVDSHTNAQTASPPNVAVGVILPHEETKPAPAPSQNLDVGENQVSKEARVTAIASNNPAADPGKAVELVFVTNAPMHNATVPEPPARPSERVESPSRVETTAATTQPNDVASGEPLLAHARAADPEEEKRAPDLALAVPPRSFLRENVKPLVLMIFAAFGAAYCFRMWFLTNARAMGKATSLTGPITGE